MGSNEWGQIFHRYSLFSISLTSFSVCPSNRGKVTLGVSADQLGGLKKVKDNGKTRDNRLWRRFNQVEKLPTNQRKQIVQILDAFLEREKLKKG